MPNVAREPSAVAREWGYRGPMRYQVLAVILALSACDPAPLPGPSIDPRQSPTPTPTPRPASSPTPIPAPTALPDSCATAAALHLTQAKATYDAAVARARADRDSGGDAVALRCRDVAPAGRAQCLDQYMPEIRAKYDLACSRAKAIYDAAATCIDANPCSDACS